MRDHPRVGHGGRRRAAGCGRAISASSRSGVRRAERDEGRRRRAADAGEAMDDDRVAAGPSADEVDQPLDVLGGRARSCPSIGSTMSLMPRKRWRSAGIDAGRDDRRAVVDQADEVAGAANGRRCRARRDERADVDRRHGASLAASAAGSRRHRAPPRRPSIAKRSRNRCSAIAAGHGTRSSPSALIRAAGRRTAAPPPRRSRRAASPRGRPRCGRPP